MEQVILEQFGRDKQAFVIKGGDTNLAEMVMAVKDGVMTVFHTEVSPELEGRGIAKTLLNAMVDHARREHLKVVPLCSYVLAQFKRHPREYGDIWQKPAGQQ
jgi:predicted GNAT family acetyltransferase